MVLSIGSEFFTAITTASFSYAFGETVHSTASHPRGQFAMKSQWLKVLVVNPANAKPMRV